MPAERPTVIVLGGVNGAGKTTSSRRLLADQLGVTSFVNADEIARGLSAFAPEAAAIAAGRVMLRRLNELAAERAEFASETTLAGRTYLSFLRSLRNNGYVVELYYLWLHSPDLAIERVRARVRRGGHNIPEPTIRQRYGRSLNNFWNGYRLEADSWFVYDNSEDDPELMAAGTRGHKPEIADRSRWQTFREAVERA
jgi:predicted ABC-type ATPase